MSIDVAKHSDLIEEIKSSMTKIDNIWTYSNVKDPCYRIQEVIAENGKSYYYPQYRQADETFLFFTIKGKWKYYIYDGDKIRKFIKLTLANEFINNEIDKEMNYHPTGEIKYHNYNKSEK